MSDRPTPKQAAELLLQLRRRQELTHHRVAGQELAPGLLRLRAWQTDRLATTHHDLLHSPRYGLAAAFFLEDIYAPKDFTQRNHDILRVHEFMTRFLPAKVLQTLTLAIALNTLTEQLDEALLQVLEKETGELEPITPAGYAAAYRACDNYDERILQIEMIVDVGYGLSRLVQLPLVGWTLRLARRPALMGGWQELQSFLQRGYDAFKHMGAADHFLQKIESRETQILDQIYASDPHPYTIESD